MSAIVVAGVGAVSPAGWGVPALRAALTAPAALTVKEIEREGLVRPLKVRVVPPPATRPAFTAHPRMRRTSAISQFAVAATLEALGADAAQVAAGAVRLGVVFSVATGCVNYCRRFFDEVLRDPATASPLLFPETVFNAPASHLAALLGTTAINYTLVGDPARYLQALAIAATWLLEERVDGVVVVGAEESDWLTSDAFRRFTRQTVLAEGAGALYLKRSKEGFGGPQLEAVTEAHLYFDRSTRCVAARRMRDELPAGDASTLLCDGQIGVPRLDEPEAAAWRQWAGPRLSPKRVLGEGLAAGVAWQCVVAADALLHQTLQRAMVSTAGTNESSVGALFVRGDRAPAGAAGDPP